jgi:hypothetical protein
VHDAETFWRYEPAEGIWQEVSEDVIANLVRRYSGAPITSRKGEPLRIRSAEAEGAIRYIRAETAKPGFFAQARDGLAFANGFASINARTGELKLDLHSSTNRARVVYPFAYEPDLQPDAFIRFVTRLYEDKPAAEIPKYVECILGFVPGHLKLTHRGHQKLTHPAPWPGLGSTWPGRADPPRIEVWTATKRVRVNSPGNGSHGLDSGHSAQGADRRDPDPRGLLRGLGRARGCASEGMVVSHAPDALGARLRDALRAAGRDLVPRRARRCVRPLRR